MEERVDTGVWLGPSGTLLGRILDSKTQRLTLKGQKIYNPSNPKTAGVVILVLGKIVFKIQNIHRETVHNDKRVSISGRYNSNTCTHIQQQCPKMHDSKLAALKADPNLTS